MPEKNYRRLGFRAQGEDTGKIRVCRNENPTFHLSTTENNIVRSVLKIVVTNVNSVLADIA